jgi:hypothetical protein
LPMTCCKLWFSSTMTMMCGCRAGAGGADLPEAGAGVRWGAGELAGTEFRGEEAPAADRWEFPHPVPTASTMTEMPAAEIPIAQRDAFRSNLMGKSKHRP